MNDGLHTNLERLIYRMIVNFTGDKAQFRV